MMKRTLGAVLIVISLIGSMLVTAGETSLTRVLFIGNSYLYYNDSLHNHVKRMASERFLRYGQSRLSVQVGHDWWRAAAASRY
jgi:hypothetical protein